MNSPHNANLLVGNQYTAQILAPEGRWRPRVCIVGFEEAVKKQAPMDDPSYEIWALNHAHRLGIMQDRQGDFRADRWFDLHEEHAQSVEDMAWIETCPVPLYLTDVFTTNPMAVRYPLPAVLEWLGLTMKAPQPQYFCSSFAYMLCLAAYLGFSEIHLSGVNLNWGRELAVERANLEYWIGFLRGRGLTITLPDSCLLCTHPYLYGFEYTQEKTWVEGRMCQLILELLTYDEIAAQYAHTVRQMYLHRATPLSEEEHHHGVTEGAEPHVPES